LSPESESESLSASVVDHPTPLIARGSKKMQLSGQSNGTAWAISIRQRSTVPAGVERDE
jgi:hypothetical protein